ncbi:MAG: hypothetical protein ACLUS6_00365 [Dysosmobacter sp.]
MAYLEFVVGQYGNSDRLVIWALSQAKRAHPDITLMLMTPYYPVNRKVDLPEAFDALFYPPDLETVPKRLAIVRANRYMVERSDFLIAYVCGIRPAMPENCWSMPGQEREREKSTSQIWLRSKSLQRKRLDCKMKLDT